jgi:hypothetical protein
MVHVLNPSNNLTDSGRRTYNYFRLTITLEYLHSIRSVERKHLFVFYKCFITYLLIVSQLILQIKQKQTKQIWSRSPWLTHTYLEDFQRKIMIAFTHKTMRHCYHILINTRNDTHYLSDKSTTATNHIKYTRVVHKQSTCIYTSCNVVVDRWRLLLLSVLLIWSFLS